MDLIARVDGPAEATLGQRIRLNPDCEGVNLEHRCVMRPTRPLCHLNLNDDTARAPTRMPGSSAAESAKAFDPTNPKRRCATGP
jgi:hypothetical protein